MQLFSFFNFFKKNIFLWFIPVLSIMPFAAPSSNINLESPKIDDSKIFKLKNNPNDKTSWSYKWWNNLTTQNQPSNILDNAIIQNQKYDYSYLDKNTTPKTFPGYGNVSYGDYSNFKKYNNQLDFPLSNSWQNKHFIFDNDSQKLLDFSWYSPDLTLNNKNTLPSYGSEYNGYDAGSRTLLMGLDFGFPMSLSYSFQSLSRNLSINNADGVSYSYNFNFPKILPFSSGNSLSNSVHGRTPQNSHYDQFRYTQKTITNTNSDDFFYYQLWNSVLAKPTNIVTFKDQGNVDPKTPNSGLFYYYNDQNIYDDTNPDFNPKNLSGNLIGHPNTLTTIDSNTNKETNVLQPNQHYLSMPFYFEYKNNLYLIHFFQFYDTKSSNTNLFTLCTQFSEKKINNQTILLSFVKKTLLHDVLWSNLISVHDTDINNLSHAYKFDESMLPYVVSFETNGYAAMNYLHPDFAAKWFNFLQTGKFSFFNDRQTTTLVGTANGQNIGDKSKQPNFIIEYPATREKYEINHSAFETTNNLLNYNKDYYNASFNQTNYFNNVHVTKYHSIFSRSVSVYHPLETDYYANYDYILLKTPSIYVNLKNKNKSLSYDWNSFVPYQYYMGIVGYYSNSTFDAPDNRLFLQPYFMQSLSMIPSVNSSLSESQNSSLFYYNYSNLSNYSIQSATSLDDINNFKIPKVVHHIHVDKWIAQILIIFLVFAFIFIFYFYFKIKRVKKWKKQKIEFENKNIIQEKTIADNKIRSSDNLLSIVENIDDDNINDENIEKTNIFEEINSIKSDDKTNDVDDLNIFQNEPNNNLDKLNNNNKSANKKMRAKKENKFDNLLDELENIDL